MIVLEQCRIDDEGKHLIIEASVENLSYNENVYIDSIIVDTNKTFSINGPSSKPVFTNEFEHLKVDSLEDCNSVTTDPNCKCGNIYTSQMAGTKKVMLVLDSNDLNGANLNDNIFFVWVVAGGIPAPETPCGMDNRYTMGVAVNLRPIYNMAMKYIKETNNDCSIPKGFVDMFLKLKAFSLAMKTGNYTAAFKQWDKLSKNKVDVPSIKGCGCNGIN